MEGHHHAAARGAGDSRRLGLALALAAFCVVAEVVGGLASHSLALLADAGHMLSDVVSLGLAIFALRMSRRPPTTQRTYGYHRAEILAALANGAALIAVSLFIFIEAVRRFRDPPEVHGGLMTVIAAGGLVVNLIGLRVLKGGRSASLNVRGSWLHVLSDTLGSVQAIAAGTMILAFGWTWIDPVASLLIGLLVIGSSWSLLREAVSVLIESAPAHIDVDAVRAAMLSVPDVAEIRDLHVWTITSGIEALSAHVRTSGGRAHRAILADIRARLRDAFALQHMTIQLEDDACDDDRGPM